MVSKVVTGRLLLLQLLFVLRYRKNQVGCDPRALYFAQEVHVAVFVEYQFTVVLAFRIGGLRQVEGGHPFVAVANHNVEMR